MAKKRYYDYPGKQVVVRFEPARCIHAAECVNGLPGVFERHRRPWIDPDAGNFEEVVEVVARCPTGALSVELPADEVSAVGAASNTARLVPAGPIYLQGRLRLSAPGAEPQDETRLALCRCGHSSNKPFCDNSHQESGFADDGGLGDETRAAVEAENADQPLDLSLAPDGPVRFQGPLEILGTDGQQHKVEKGYLCRCGASKRKPYCDGSHREIGFEAD